MEIKIIEPLVLTTIPRNAYAPWLAKNSNKIKLVQPFIIYVKDPIESVDQHIVIPAGYISDWASIPALFWRLFPPNHSESRHGSMVHDYLYSHLYHYFTKSFADRLLRDFMIADGASRFAANAFHLAVKLGGRGGWQECQKQNANSHWHCQHRLITYHGQSVDEYKAEQDCGV
jgi:hypothetical protein